MCDSSLTSKTPDFQSGEAGARPSLSLFFYKTTLKEVSSFVKSNHYSHTHPGGIDYAFGLNYNGKLAGVCLFGYMAGNPIASCIIQGVNDQSKYRELMRLVLLDEVPKNSESKFISWCIRWLKKNTDLAALISFADPKYGHSGTIYKASNWTYCGLQKQDRDRIFINEKEVHPKSAYNIYGTSSIEKLKQMGLQIRTEPREPKHRYVYVLRDEYKKLLKSRIFQNT